MKNRGVYIKLMLVAEKKRKLTLKQQRFVDAYEGNATDAARKAGYKNNPEAIRSTAYENLTKPHVVEAIASRQNVKTEQIIATRTDRQALWTEMLQDPARDDNIRLKASELLGKSEADFIEVVKTDHTLDITNALTTATKRTLAAKATVIPIDSTPLEINTTDTESVDTEGLTEEDIFS